MEIRNGVFVFLVACLPLGAHADTLVRAKIGPPSVSGALICQDYDTVQMMIQAFNVTMEASMEATMLGKERYKAMHGNLPSVPNVKQFGCLLVPAGTKMQWNENWMPAIVIINMRNGRTFKGVTDPSMIDTSQ